MIGIDLGTTNSVVAISEGTEPVVIANAEGERTTPSVVAFGENGEVLVGEPAKRQAVTDVGRTIRSVKHAMGTDRKIAVDGRAFVPQQISALVLQKLKLDAESHLGEKVTDALITLPAGLSEHQRQAVTEAGRIAGLNVLRVIDEPTSAALAHHARNETDAMILVFDLGGGSCSAAMIEVGDGVVAAKATSGNGHLGGDDWDNAIVDWAVGRFKTAHGIDLAKTRRRWSGCARPARKPRSNCPPPVRRGSPFPTSAVPPGGRCTWTRRSPVPSSRR